LGKPITIFAQPGQITYGTTRSDVILGTAHADDIRGNGGGDFICGQGGDDTLTGGNGPDTGEWDEALRARHALEAPMIRPWPLDQRRNRAPGAAEV
jgi:hypothetical protein